MQSLMRRAWVEVDLGALLHNARTIAVQAGVPLLPMVKADAYGLGAVRVARALEELQPEPWGFGVATIAEGEELRGAGISRPILVFTPLLRGDFDAALRSDLTPTLGDRRGIQEWAPTQRPWHLAIDTGMSRAGVQWTDVEALRPVLTAHPPAGAFTHFHSAEQGDGSRERQEQRFEEAVARLPVRPAMLHAENSPGVEHRRGSSWSIVRPGVFLYGVGSGHGADIVPNPVASLRARVVDLRTIAEGETVSYGGTYRATGNRRIATLAIGYADGYRRALSNRGSALLRGRRVPVVGVVTMDMTMLDVTDVPCEVGDVATLIGLDGEQSIDVAEVAEAGGLSPYEVLTSLRGRLPRKYVDTTAEGQT
jgi:alanine racemase